MHLRLEQSRILKGGGGAVNPPPEMNIIYLKKYLRNFKLKEISDSQQTLIKSMFSTKKPSAFLRGGGGRIPVPQLVCQMVRYYAFNFTYYYCFMLILTCNRWLFQLSFRDFDTRDKENKPTYDLPIYLPTTYPTKAI